MQRNFSPITILLSLFMAIVFWGYVSLNATYTTFTNFDLQVNLPPNRAISNELPTTIFIKVRGNGWKLMNLLYFPGSRPRAEVDVSRVSPQIRDTYILNKRDILTGLHMPVNVDVLDVTPENIRFTTDVIAEKRVPVESKLNIHYKPGFIPIGDLHISPDSIIIRGSRSALANIHKWPTAEVTLDNVFRSFHKTVMLKDTLRNFVSASRRSVAVSAEVQQMAEIVIPDIPVELVNAPAGNTHRLRPDKISLVVRGGAYHLENLAPNSFRAVVDYYSLLDDSVGFVAPRLIYPGNVKVIRQTPEYLRHTQKINGQSLVAETLK